MVIVLGLVPALGGTASAQSYFVTTAWHEWAESYWGNLTWNGGAKGISWEPDPPSEDDQPADATPSQAYNGDWNVQYYTGNRLIHTRPTHVFTSAPVTKALHLNVSRPILFELALTKTDTTNFCPRALNQIDPIMEVVVKVDRQRIASSFHNDYFVARAGMPAGSDPSSYNICRFAMGPEMDIVPEGAIVTIEITFYAQQRTYQMGFQGDHRSRIRFPLYPLEEVVYRHPELFEEDEESDDVGTTAATFNAAPAALLVLGALAGLARPHRSAAFVLLMVTAGLAGCLSKDDKGGPAQTEELLRGGVTLTQIKGDDDLAAAGRGSIIGVVHDDLHIPVPGVHVSVIGLANFTTTSSKGTFQLLGLPAGLLKVRFDKMGYSSFEAEIEVKPGFISRPEITLYPADAKERDLRPHSHDYWSGATRKELMNGPVPHLCGGNVGAGCGFLEPFRVPPKEGQTNTVLPGTAEVELVLDWDPEAVGVSRYGLILDANGDRSTLNRTVFGPRGPGEPFRIATNWDMTDVGHLHISEWVFQLFEGDPFARGGYSERTPAIHYSDPARVTAKVTIERGGTLPLEPGHPDRWGDATEIPVVKAKEQGSPGQCFYPPGTQPPATRCKQYIADWAAEKFVPAGTSHLEVTLTIGRQNALPTDYRFMYKPANVAAIADAYSNERPGYIVVEGSGGSDPLKKTWKILVKEGQHDPEYAKKPAWAFALEGMDKNSMYLDYEAGATYPGKQTYTLDVKAVRA